MPPTTEKGTNSLARRQSLSNHKLETTCLFWSKHLAPTKLRIFNSVILAPLQQTKRTIRSLRTWSTLLAQTLVQNKYSRSSRCILGDIKRTTHHWWKTRSKPSTVWNAKLLQRQGQASSYSRTQKNHESRSPSQIRRTQTTITNSSWRTRTIRPRLCRQGERNRRNHGGSKTQTQTHHWRQSTRPSAT